MNRAISLKGKRALVTGASQGIGRALAVALAEIGMHVCVVGRDVEKLQDLCDELGEGASIAYLDLADTHSIDTLASEQSSNIDLLVNCGGLYSSGTMSTAEPATFKQMVATNILGPYELTRQLLPGVIANRGQIVFINSSVIKGVGAHTGQFAATAQALLAVADSLRAEVNPLGVRVLSVFPGRTATPRQARIFASEGRDYQSESLLQPEDVAASVVHSVSLPSTAELTDLWLRPAQNFKR